MRYIESLNERQKEAVLNTEGAMLVLAGAGSGKTKVITNKISYLIDEKAVYPSSILAITFTNKAANEMKDRVASMLDVRPSWIGTFHSVCSRILRKDIERIGYSKNFVIYDRSDQLTVIRDAVKELDFNSQEYKDTKILPIISKLKAQQINPHDYQKSNYNSIFHRKVGEIYELYEKRLFLNNALDFDDLLIKAVYLLKTEEEVLKYYQKKFQYIFVDEYQDTNGIQYEFIKLLSKGYGNITVVGDIDQSIYGWRGADISNILNFERDFKDSSIVLLEENYRSTSNILEIANNVISYNEERKDKNLFTSNGEGAPVEYHELADNEEEANFVLSKIIELKAEAYKESDFAILYRTNAQSRNFEEAFFKLGVRYRIIGGLKFYDRLEIKDIIAYLKLAINPSDDVAFRRVVNSPKRGIGQTTVDKLTEIAIKNEISLFDVLYVDEFLSKFSKRTENLLKNFRDMMGAIRANAEFLSVKELVEDVIDRTGYIRALEKEDTVEARSRIENVKEFLTVALNFEMTNEDGSIFDFLTQMSLLSDQEKSEDEGDLPSVTLMTVHSAKGLEFPVIFMVGMEEGIFPSSLSIEEGNIEEERRLCYVAITRAEKRLFISSVNLRSMYGKNTYFRPSSFIAEMGDSLEVHKSRANYREYKEEKFISNPFSYTGELNYFKKKPVEKTITKTDDLQVGEKVNHKKFGNGMVVQVKIKDDGDKEYVVAFDTGGIKRLLASISPLERLDG